MDWLGVAIGVLIGGVMVWGGPPDPAVERGQVAMTSTGYLKPAWREDAYRRARELWGKEAPASDTPPDAYRPPSTAAMASIRPRIPTTACP